MQAVVLHVCLRTELSRALGVEAHVCELQLLTAGFHAVLQARPAAAPGTPPGMSGIIGGGGFTGAGLSAWGVVAQAAPRGVCADRR